MFDLRPLYMFYKPAIGSANPPVEGHGSAARLSDFLTHRNESGEERMS
jgi:hypothetical protein